MLPIEDESSWRSCTQLNHRENAPEFAVGRWNERRRGSHEVTADPLENYFTVDILLKDTVLDFYTGDRRIKSGAVAPGATQVTAPGERVSCRFDRSVEAIHLFVSRSLIVSTYEDAMQRSCPPDFALRDPALPLTHR